MTLQDYITKEILPRYQSSEYDSAHRPDHIYNVINHSMDLAQYYDVDKDMVYVIAAYHDLGVKEGREWHHISSGRMLMEDENLKTWFSPEQLLIMKEAIEDHRASSKNKPRSVYGMIVSEADRDIDPETVIRRTVEFGLDHYPELSKEEQYQRFCQHLQEKYAEGGYLKLLLPQSHNVEKLSELRKIISNPTLKREMFESCYSAIFSPAKSHVHSSGLPEGESTQHCEEDPKG